MNNVISVLNKNQKLGRHAVSIIASVFKTEAMVYKNLQFQDIYHARIHTPTYKVKWINDHVLTIM